MKIQKLIPLLVLLLITIPVVYLKNVEGATCTDPNGCVSYCYPDGCITMNEPWFSSIEEKKATNSTGYEKYATGAEYMMADYQGAVAEEGGGVKATSYDTDGIVLSFTCFNGRHTTFQRKPYCKNGASNPPDCNVCGDGTTRSSTASSTQMCTCNNGATNPTICNQCPAGQGMYEGICGCANGAINPPQCNQCGSSASMQGGQCVCGNGAIPQTNCAACPTGKAMYHDQCVDACDITNVCGLQAKGILDNGVCKMPDDSDANSSCISTFTVDTDHVNPDGSAEFTWGLNDKIPSTIGSRCGFVDLTTSNPRPIPGLQNLDPKQDRVRISNIQATTRFCLICQFYKLLDQSVIGNTAVHQWVRVQRVGEQQ